MLLWQRYRERGYPTLTIRWERLLLEYGTVRDELRDFLGLARQNANLEGVGFVDENRGWVGGWGTPAFEGGQSSAISDGGESWDNANEIGKFINRFRFLGSPVTVGYAAGATVYKYSGQPVPAPTGPARSASSVASSVTRTPTIRCCRFLL